MRKKESYTIRLDRDAGDALLSKGFFELVTQRLLPVLGLTYILSIIGIAISLHDVAHYTLFHAQAYFMGLFVVLWVAGPGVIWIVLQCSIMFVHVADVWYRILSGLMVITVAICTILFPEADMYGLRAYLILSVPMFVVMYFFLVRGNLPLIMAYPLNALGFCALIYGAAVHVIF